MSSASDNLTMETTVALFYIEPWIYHVQSHGLLMSCSSLYIHVMHRVLKEFIEKFYEHITVECTTLVQQAEDGASNQVNFVSLSLIVYFLDSNCVLVSV
ncbi:hypothetical protein PTKIN_Ptkin01aG0116800 [Pterospermum kingtungense]